MYSIIQTICVCNLFSKLIYSDSKTYTVQINQIVLKQNVSPFP